MTKLIQAATQARLHARAPYSRFQVGAALEADDGRVFAGCNVEISSYGLTVCAERVAAFHAIAQGARLGSGASWWPPTSPKPAPPCGACRQVLWDLCGDIEITLVNLGGDAQTFSLSSCSRDLSMTTRWLSCILLPALVWAEPADWLLTAGYVVTVDAQRRVIENGAVAVRGDRIAAVGPRAELEKRFQPRRRLDRPQAILAPGLVNTHTHAPMSLFRGIADDLRLQDWLEKFIFPAEAKNVSAEFCRWGTRLAVLEMLLGGTTTYTDMYYFEETIAAETKAAGMRGVLGQTMIGFPVADAKTPAEGLVRAEAFIKAYRNDPLVAPAVAPHALYTNSDETLRRCRTLANENNVPLLIHLSETRRENDESRSKRQASPAQALNALGLFDGRTVAAHGVWLDEVDLALIKAKNVGIAHCPSSNMKLASGIAPVARMLALGIDVVSGPMVRRARTTISICLRRWTWPRSWPRSRRAIRRRSTRGKPSTWLPLAGRAYSGSTVRSDRWKRVSART